jgi:CheY-like chemotaxis protein
VPRVNDLYPMQERRSQVRKRALVVGCDVLARVETRLLLEMHGYQVDEVSDGMEAIGLLDLEAPRLDLVVLDCEMPMLSGLETLQALRALQPGLKALLAITGSEALRPGLPERVAFLKRPCTLHGLSEGLDTVYGITRHNLGHGKAASFHRVRLVGHLPHYPPR